MPAGRHSIPRPGPSRESYALTVRAILAGASERWGLRLIPSLKPPRCQTSLEDRIGAVHGIASTRVRIQ